MNGKINLNETLNTININKFMNDDKETIYDDLLLFKNESSSKTTLFDNRILNSSFKEDSSIERNSIYNNSNTFRNGFC